MKVDEIEKYCKDNHIIVEGNLNNKRIKLTKDYGKRKYIFSSFRINEEDKEKGVFYRFDKLDEMKSFFDLIEFREKKMDVYLSEYLKEVSDYEDPKKLFHCINPTHEDEHASMGLNMHNNTYSLTNLI